MVESVTNTPAQRLAIYVSQNEVAWQMRDTLIEFSCGARDNGSHNDCDQSNARMLTLIRNAKECRLFHPTQDDNTGLEDLIHWSKSGDTLVLVDNELLLCCAPCDKEIVLSTIA